MTLRQDPCFKGAAGGKGDKGGAGVVLNNHSPGELPLFIQQPAERAGSLCKVSTVCPLQLLPDSGRNKGESNELGVRMFDRGARFTAVVAEDLQITQVAIICQHPAAPVISFDDEIHLPRREAAGVAVMLRDLNQHFMSAVTRDQSSPGIRFRLFAQLHRRILVRHHPDPPTGRIRGRRAAPKGKELRRCHLLIPCAKRTALYVSRNSGIAVCPVAISGKSCGPSGALRGDDHLPPGDGITANFGQTRHLRDRLSTG